MIFICINIKKCKQKFKLDITLKPDAFWIVIGMMNASGHECYVTLIANWG